MRKEDIKAQRTYRTEGGRFLYVHELNGQKVTFCDVGNVERKEASLGRFISRIVSEEPNR